MIENELPLDDLPAPLREVLEYWRARGGEELKCGWRDFNLEDLPASVLPTTLVVDVKPDPGQNVFRFYGTGMRYIHGTDMTGRTTAELEPPELAETVRRNHATTVRINTADASTYGFERHGGFDHRQSLLRLPLSDDGENVHHIVIVIDLTSEARDELAKARGGQAL